MTYPAEPQVLFTVENIQMLQVNPSGHKGAQGIPFRVQDIEQLFGIDLLGGRKHHHLIQLRHPFQKLKQEWPLPDSYRVFPGIEFDVNLKSAASLPSSVECTCAGDMLSQIKEEHLKYTSSFSLQA